MSFNLQKLKSIKGTTTMLVFGYVREIQRKYFTENDTSINTHYDIPPLIYYICLAFTPIKYRSYKDFNLKQDLISGISSLGFSKPSKIQTLIIPPILDKRNVVCQTHAITHKISSYTMAALQMIDPNKSQCQVLIISQEWEECLGLCFVNIFESLSKYLPVCVKVFRNKASLCDVDAINDIQFMVASTTSIDYMISKHLLNIKSIKLLILDGIDILLEDNKEQISGWVETISVHQHAQVVIFSDAVTDTVSQFVQDYIRNPVTITYTSEEEFSLNGVKQYYIDVEKEDYCLATFVDLCESMTLTQTIVYCNTSRKVMWLCETLKQQHDFTCSAVHDDMDCTEREQVFKEIRMGGIRMLIATDSLANETSLNVKGFFIVHYDIPRIKENYFHQRNTTMRTQMLVNFVRQNDVDKVLELENFYNTQIAEFPIYMYD